MEVELLRRDAGGNWPASPLIVRQKGEIKAE